MDNTYQKEWEIRAFEVDLENRWKMESIYVCMQEVADDHAEILGMGREASLAAGRYWVVARNAVEMIRFPIRQEKILVTTWPGKTVRMGFPRHFTFETKEGELLGVATSLWMLVDRDTRKMLPPKSIDLQMPDNSEIPDPLPLPGRIRLEQETQPPVLYDPVYSDLDFNHHVNNTRYVQWICDQFPPRRFVEGQLNKLQVNYSNEIRYGQQVRLRMQQNGEEFILVGEDAADGGMLFEAQGEWDPPQQSTRTLSE